VKGVFDTKTDSGYDDDIARRYHFPQRYLSIANEMVGDWVVYREPRRNHGRQAYVAVARVVGIEPDPTVPNHYYALVDEFLPFDHLVPLNDDGQYAEEPLRGVAEPAQVGIWLQGRSVRPLDAADFARIVRAGLRGTLDPDNALKLELDPSHVDAETEALLSLSEEEQERRIVRMLVNRKIRDASFRGQVCDAYENTCAITGLQMINGGGKAEVQAAHIWPVSSGGPDTVPNGIALSATVHWLFDRHLISLTDDYGLLVSHNRVPSDLQVLFERQRKQIRLPKDRRLHPRLEYVRRHRAIFAAA
jgi:putative restriction endonuclease